MPGFLHEPTFIFGFSIIIALIVCVVLGFEPWLTGGRRSWKLASVGLVSLVIWAYCMMQILS